MPLSRTTNRRLLKLFIVIIFFGIIVAYAISRSFNYVSGPEIKIFEPANGSATTSPAVTIQGQALRVNKITLNGKSILIDEKGYWKETIIIFQGLNKITLYAEDQFGRNTREELDLVGEI